MKNTAPNSHFGLNSVRNSLKYFVFGKGSNAFLSVAILFALAALMSEKDYAAFISWQALVMLIGLISTFGIQSIMHRFLPELRADNSPLVYKLLFIGIAIRFLFAIIVVSSLIAVLPWLTELLKVPDQDGLLSVFLLVGALHMTGLSLAQACDALLWQRLSQVSLVISNFFRVGAILTVHFSSTISLQHVIIIELIAELAFLSLLLLGAKQHWQGDSTDQATDTQWWPENKQRVVRYGASKYLVVLSWILYGSAPNRLLAAQFSTSKEIALLGFADSVIRLGRRFMPAVLMISFIRPLFIARYTTGSGFASLVEKANLIFRVNFAFLMVLIVGVLVVGEPIFDFLTNGKYGAAYLLVFGFLVLLVVEALRLILELLIEVTELNKISMLSNIVQSGSLLVAIPLFNYIGLWALVVANIMGTLLAIVVCVIQLHRHNFILFFEGKLVGLILLQGLMVWGAGYAVQAWLSSTVLSGLAVCICALALGFIAPPMTKDEIKQLKSLVSRKKNAEYTKQ